MTVVIYEEDRTVDEMVDDIFDAGTVRDTETVSTGGAQAGTEDARRAPSKEVTERASCRKCGRMFVKPKQSARTLCQDCFAASRAHRKTAKKTAANDRQIKTENSAEQKGTEKVETKEKTVAQAEEKLWDALGEAETKANTPAAPPPERAPEDMNAGELVDALAAGMRREPGDVVLALYEAARDVARTSGIQTRVLIETMYELDCTLAHVGSV